MDRIERLTAVLEGRQPDRPPVSFWHHFPLDCAAGPAAVAAHVRHIETYDLDFLKIMDDNRYPRVELPGGVVAGTDDLERLAVLSGSEDRFGRQLELIEALARRYAGEFRMITTVFNTWATLRLMTVPEAGGYGPPKLGSAADPRDAVMARWLREVPETLGQTLQRMAESQANFVRDALAAGADGIFFSVRDDWIGGDENGDVYNRCVQPTDLTILQAAQSAAFNLLHVCGQARDFARFAAYPVHAVNWADRYAGPTISEVARTLRPAICGGLNNLGTLAHGTPDDCAAEVADALRQAGPRPIIIAPGCTFDPTTVPPANLHAVRRAVERGLGTATEAITSPRPRR